MVTHGIPVAIRRVRDHGPCRGVSYALMRQLAASLRPPLTTGRPAPASARLALLVVASAMMASCDYSWELRVDASVPGATQAAVEAYPQQLLVRYRHRVDAGAAPGWSVHRLAVLCAPTDDPVVAHARFWSVGPECSSTYDVEGWLAPIEPGSGTACGPRETAEHLYPCDTLACAPQVGEPFGSAVAFDEGCQRADTVAFDLVR